MLSLRPTNFLISLSIRASNPSIDAGTGSGADIAGAADATAPASPPLLVSEIAVSSLLPGVVVRSSSREVAASSLG